MAWGFVRKALVVKGDINAVSKGKILPRVGRRVYGKATGKLAGRLFK